MKPPGVRDLYYCGVMDFGPCLVFLKRHRYSFVYRYAYANREGLNAQRVKNYFLENLEVDRAVSYLTRLPHNLES
jgi:hypothetical protein